MTGNDRNGSQVVGDLYGGLTDRQLGQAIREAVAMRLNNPSNRAKASVDVHLEFDRVGDENSNLVQVTHKITYQQPTMSGARSENFQRTTQMYADKRGNLTLEPAAMAFVPKHKVEDEVTS